MSHPHNNEDPRWLDDPKNIDRLYRALVVACALLLIADLGYHRHPHFELESLPGFYAMFGFVAFVGIVQGGIQLRKLIMREKDYYDG